MRWRGGCVADQVQLLTMYQYNCAGHACALLVPEALMILELRH
jgi:hypothetical protein